MDTLLSVAAVFITPDWNGLLALFPVFLAIAFAAWVSFTTRQWASAGPRRRAPARIQPITPASVHMPGGSTAPILVALGAGALFAGIILESIGVFPHGVAIGIGVIALIATLIAWGREAIRDYDHIDAP